MMGKESALHLSATCLNRFTLAQVNELQSAVMKIGENLQKAAGGSEGGDASGGAGASGSAEAGTTYDAEAKEDKK